MLARYIQAAMRRAKYDILSDDGSYYGEIPGFQGVWANAVTFEECREELEEVLGEWMLFRIWHHNPLPVVEGIDLTASDVPIADAESEGAPDSGTPATPPQPRSGGSQ